jgi:hypothetical protein
LMVRMVYRTMKEVLLRVTGRWHPSVRADKEQVAGHNGD